MPITTIALAALAQTTTVPTLAVDPSAATSRGFGAALDADGALVAVGAVGSHGAFTTHTPGSVVLLSDAGDLVAELTGSLVTNRDGFGSAIALDAASGVLVVGAPQALQNRGRAYVFERDASGIWAEVARFDGQPGREVFGTAVAVEADVALIGQPDFDGTVHVIQRTPGGAWIDAGDLPNPPTVFPSAEFGAALDMEGGRAVVGAPGEDAASYDSGAAYVYTRGPAGFTLDERLEHPSATVVTYHGEAVAIDVEGTRTRVLVGSEADRAFLWESDGGPFLTTAILTAHDGSSARFGVSVDLDGDLALVGAPGRSGTTASSGAALAYAIETAGDVRALGVVHPTSPAIGDFAFAGATVAVERGTLWMGAPYADLVGDASGALLRADGSVRIGEAYCVGRRNSGLGVATLAVRGSDLASDRLIGIDAVGLPGATATLLIASAERDQVPALGGGAGELCLGGTLFRILATTGFSTPGGVRALDIDFAAIPPGLSTVSGSTLCFQLWYRDFGPLPTSNTTDAIEVLLR